MRKSHVRVMAYAFLLAVALLVSACSASIQNMSLEQPHNSDAESKAVELTPSDPIEYDTSMPQFPVLQSVESDVAASVLILMYHNITTLTDPGTYDRRLQNFDNDLKYLQDNNITIIRLSDILKIQSGEIVSQEGQRFAVISFDDGYVSAYARAFPILKKYNMPATFFIITSFVGTSGYMTWEEIEEIAGYSPDSGRQPLYEFGSHTVDHRSLAYDASAFPDRNDYIMFLNMELNQSKNAILQHVNQTDIFLALPYGDGAYEQEVTCAAIRTGYTGLRTSIYGAFDAYNTNWNYHLPSLAILGSTSISVLPDYYEQLLPETGMLMLSVR
ncbi:MAG: polysaccharide deacetylase family protein [Rectinema sp.]